MIYFNKWNSYPLSSLTKVHLYGFWLEPHLIGHHRQYLPHGGSNSKWLHKLVQLRWNNNNNKKSYAYDSVAVKPLKMKLTFY